MRTPTKFQKNIRTLHQVNKSLGELEEFETWDIDNWDLNPEQIERYQLIWEKVKDKLKLILTLK